MAEKKRSGKKPGVKIYETPMQLHDPTVENYYRKNNVEEKTAKILSKMSVFSPTDEVYERCSLGIKMKKELFEKDKEKGEMSELSMGNHLRGIISDMLYSGVTKLFHGEPEVAKEHLGQAADLLEEYGEVAKKQYVSFQTPEDLRHLQENAESLSKQLSPLKDELIKASNDFNKLIGIE